MQLKKPRSGASGASGARVATLGSTLAAATATLLGQSVTTNVLAQELLPWEFDTAALYYSESDSRVRDFSVNVLATKEVREESTLSLRLALDTLTGASQSGAAPAHAVQTFTSPSGGERYAVAAGELPLDPSFLDTRVAVGANYAWPVSRLTRLDVGVSVSDEYDYTHAGLNMKLARDFNNRNTTLSFGVAVANDTIDAVGGAPLGLELMTGERGDDDDGGSFGGGSRSTDVTDLLIGLTQVINRRTIVQFNFSLSQSDGYLTDPYKILSVVDPIVGNPVPLSGGDDIDYTYRFEHRPDTREKQGFYGLLKRDVSGDVFDVSYRYMSDDWDIDSHTIDMHYKWNFDSGSYFQPHIRFYSQTAAGFYQTVLFDGEPLPLFATADYRLSEFDAITLGVKFGKPTRNGEVSGRLEFYQQTGSASPGSAVGSLRDFDLNPDLNALIAQFSYRFGG
jgi:hypothetical protein